MENEFSSWISVNFGPAPQMGDLVAPGRCHELFGPAHAKEEKARGSRVFLVEPGLNP